MAVNENPASILNWLRLANTPWLGATVRAGLVKAFRDPSTIFSLDKVSLSSIQGWTSARLGRFMRERSRIPPLCSLEALEANKIRVVTYEDPAYPEMLRHIPDAPILLFALGDLKPDPRPHIAIIGSRNGSQMGFDIARDFAKTLASAGFVVVSGLALGIDTFAHLGALDSNGKTIAVLGCGPDITYPSRNRQVRQRILHSGALLSEYPPGEKPKPWHFPVRNRIISGMCVGTLVVEASARSGSLITARLAAEQDREVFAIPGSIRSSLAEGTLNLLQEGALLVTSPAELIEHFRYLLPEGTPASVTTEIDLNDDERKLVETLSVEPISMDNLLQDRRWTRERLFSLLLTLEMRDILVKLPGDRYQAKIKLFSGR